AEEIQDTVEDDDEATSPHAWALLERSSTRVATHRTLMSGLARFNSTGWLHELNLPVAVVKTMRDLAFPQSLQDEMADLLPRSAVFPFEGGHAGCATRPGTFARRMRTGIGWVVSESGVRTRKIGRASCRERGEDGRGG